MGRPREIIEKTDAKAGDDVYLTIDRDLQIAIYKLIEQQLAGIISYHLQYDDLDPDKTYDPSKIPDSCQGRLLPVDQQQCAVPDGYGPGRMPPTLKRRFTAPTWPPGNRSLIRYATNL
ncbi:MAG: hypothetical protein ACLTBV_21055 [Enterocloster bolteae]